MRWRRALAAHVNQASQRAMAVSGRAFIDLLTHLLLDQEPLVQTDVSELIETYRVLGPDAATVRGALVGVASENGWVEAGALSYLLVSDATRGSAPPRFPDYLRALRCMRDRVATDLRGGALPIRVSRNAHNQRTRVVALSPRFVVDASQHGALIRGSANAPASVAQRDAVWRVLAPALSKPLLVDQGARLTTYVVVAAKQPYAIDVEGPYVVSVMPLSFPSVQEQQSQVSAGDGLRSAFGAFVQGFAEVPAGLSQAIAVAATWLDQNGPEFIATGRKTEALVTYRFGEWIREAAAKHFPTEPKLAQSFVLHMVPGALGNLTGFALGGWASALAKGSALGFTMVAGSGMEGAGQYSAALEAGVDEATAQKAFGAGLLVGTSEAIPFSRMIRRVDTATGGKASQLLRRGGVSALEEFVQEWTQTGAGNAVARAFYDQNRSLFAGTLEAGTTGAAASAVFFGVMSGALRVRQRGGAPAAASSEAQPTMAGGPKPDPGRAAWFSETPDSFVYTQSSQYWRELQRTVESARDPSATTQKRIAYIRRISEGSNIPHLAWQSPATTYDPAIGRRALSVDAVAEQRGNCKFAAVSTIEMLGTGLVATPLRSEYTTKGPHYSPHDDFRARGVRQATMQTTGNKQAVVGFFQTNLQEGQLAYLRTGNDKVGHATAIVKLGGKLYSINNQNWYKRLRIPPDQLQPLERFLYDWESWTRDPGAYGDPATHQSLELVYEYDGFVTSYRVQADAETSKPRDVPDDDWEYVR